MSADAIRDRLGRTRGAGDGSWVPAEVDYYDVGGPTSFGAPRGLRGPGGDATLRYAGVSWLLEQDRLWAFMTVERGARTRGGVAIGDDQDRVREAYPDARCFTANERSEYPTFPLCEVRPANGVRMWFGSDPVRSITYAVTGDAAFRRLARR